MTHQRGLAPRARLKPLHRRHQNTNIPRRRTQPQRRHDRLDQRENFRIRRRRVLSVKDLIADLRILIVLAGIIFLTPEHLPRIGIARRLRPMLHMHLHNRHCKIGPKHLLAPKRVRGHISTPPDILAIKIKKDFGRLQHIGFNRLCPFRLEHGAQLCRPRPDFSPSRHIMRPALQGFRAPSPQGRHAAPRTGSGVPSTPQASRSRRFSPLGSNP